jgi:hypothetical protein
MRTYQVERAAVACVLSGVAFYSGGSWTEWLGALAVLAGFSHAQVADRLAEREAARDVPAVECHAKAARYWVAKEVLWFAYFVAHRSWAALAGCVLFIAYPFWRRLWRAHHPMAEWAPEPGLVR